MSHTLAAAATRRSVDRTTSPARRPVKSAGPQLRVVRAPAAKRGQTGFVVCCLLLLVSGLLVLLMVNTSLAQGSFTLHDLQAATGDLADREQALQQEVDVKASPEELSRAARGLGMIPSVSPGFVRLSDGRVFGAPKPARLARSQAAVVTGVQASGGQPKTKMTPKGKASKGSPTVPAKAPPVARPR